MRPETAERKKKAAKNKEVVDKILREEGASKSLSKLEKNKLILKTMVKNSESDNEEASDTDSENIKKKGIWIKEFTCKCGCEVRIEGDLAKDDSITMCSTCRSK